MTQNQIFNSLANFLDELADAVQADPSLRRSLRKLWHAVSDDSALGDDSAPENEVVAASAPQDAQGEEDELRKVAALQPSGDEPDDSTSNNATSSRPQDHFNETQDAAPAPREPLPPLTLGQGTGGDPSTPRVTVVRRTEEVRPNLGAIALHCQLKARGSRWAFERRQQSLAGVHSALELDDEGRQLIDEAREADCFLWMCNAACPTPDRSAAFQELADCYEALAEACELADRSDLEQEGPSSQLEKLLYLTAEAQSALRVAVAALGAPPDHDQLEAFSWLKTVTHEQQIFVAKYMRADDQADPTDAAALRDRIREFAESMNSQREQVRLRKKLLSKIRHKSGLLATGTEGSREELRILINSVETLLGQGLPPSNRELREALLPMVDAIPADENLPAGFQLVMREIDLYLAQVSSGATTASAEAPESEDVRHCRQLLAGRKVILIGGVRRPRSHEALREALGVDDVIWIETREHQSIDGFEPYVARADVAVVLLAIRWASHSFGDVREFCERYQKPLVRLPGGYNANQVAAQILQQCSDRLRMKAS